MYEFVALSLKCRFCGESLMDNKVLVDNEPSIRLDVKHSGQKGTIHLSSIYGSYNYSCSIDIPKDEIAEFHCPHCSKKVNSAVECLSCGAEMVPFYLDMGGKVSICARSGCKNHHVEFEDLSLALKKLYQEYGFRGRKYRPELKDFINQTQEEGLADEITRLEQATFGRREADTQWSGKDIFRHLKTARRKSLQKEEKEKTEWLHDLNP